MILPEDPLHRDYSILQPIRRKIEKKVGGMGALRQALPGIIERAVEFVIDPVHTARTRIEEIDNVEKTFIGLKIEHFFRDFVDLPKGVRDLDIDGTALDIKNTVGSTWMIPPETYRVSEPCLLISTAVAGHTCNLGLLVARDEYLGKPNRDRKRSVKSVGKQNILWLVKDEPMPRSRWEGLDMQLFRQLRSLKGGSKRAAAFFADNLDRPIHRIIVQALLHDQRDPLKRVRGNGGARDRLKEQGIDLFSGQYDKKRIAAAGLKAILRDEFIAVHR